MLLSLTACKTTAYVVPVIQEPIIETEPTHAPWQFVAIDEHNFIISDTDLKVLIKYIQDLKVYGLNGWDWVQYYIDELKNVEEKFK